MRKIQASRSFPATQSRYTRRHKPANLQHQESESELQYYENCWLDPLRPLGGGSFLTWSGCLAESSGVSTQSLNGSTPQNLGEPIDSQNSMIQPSNTTCPSQHPAAGSESSQSWRDKRTIPGVWTDSQQCLAPTLLETVGENRSDFTRSNAPFHDDGSTADCGHRTDDRY